MDEDREDYEVGIYKMVFFSYCEILHKINMPRELEVTVRVTYQLYYFGFISKSSSERMIFHYKLAVTSIFIHRVMDLKLR